jgi:hypothetical protein
VSALVKVVGGRIVPVLALVGVLLLAGCAGGLTTTAGNATATPVFSPAAACFLFKDVISLGVSFYLISYFGKKAILSENKC